MKRYFPFVCLAYFSLLEGYVIRDDVSDSQYISLGNDPRFSACGALDMDGGLCTGTLINPRTVLSAAHCFTPTAPPISSQFLLGPTINPPYNDSALGSAFANHPNYTGLASGFDIALFSIKRRIVSVNSIPIRTDNGPNNLIRELAFGVGYGQSGTGNNPVPTAAGTKRGVKHIIDVNGTFEDTPFLLVTDFDSPQDNTNTLLSFGSAPVPLDLEGMTGSGDSGGPLFTIRNGMVEIVGVVSTSSDPVIYGATGQWCAALPMMSFINANNFLRSVRPTNTSPLWSIASNWSEGQVPNNIEVITDPLTNTSRYFDVSISSGAIVTDINFTIDSLNVIGPTASVSVPVGLSPTVLETTLTAGELQVLGTLSTECFLQGGILSGTGTIQTIQRTGDAGTSSLHNLKGVISPGTSASLGQMTVIGGYEQGSTATLQIETNRIVSDKLIVSQTAALNGICRVALLSEMQPKDRLTFTVLQAASIQGTFSSLTGLPGLYQGVLSYTPTTVAMTLFLPEHPLENAGVDRNQKIVGRVLDEIALIRYGFPTGSVASFAEDSSSSFFKRQNGLGDDDEEEFDPEALADLEEGIEDLYLLDIDLVQPALDQLQPLAYYPIILSNVQVSRRQNELLRARLATSHCCDRSALPWGAYLDGELSIGERSSFKETDGFDVKSRGLTAGFDARVCEDFLAGLAASYFKGDFALDQHRGAMRLKGPSIAGYAAYAWGQTHFDAIVRGGYYQIREKRNITFSSLNETARASSHMRQFDASLGAGYLYCCNAVRFEPKLSLDYVSMDFSHYQEHAAPGFELSVKGADPSFLFSNLGASLGYEACLANSSFLPYVKGAWIHEYLHENPNLDASFLIAPNLPMHFLTDKLGENFWSAGAGFIYNFSGGAKLIADYEAAFGEHSYLEHTIDLSLQWQF